MFNKILIANRGEIACRVMRTAGDMGIDTVAVYSEADANSLHVNQADEAVLIGPAAAAESYLNIDKLIDAALQTGAQAIHPGYGFLSENPLFVEAVEKAGLVFIGPSADAIRAMGLKDAAKALMEQSGVPVVPGYHGENQDAGFLAEEADRIGYPVLIKARAGGGGKGMRLVEDPSKFAEALEGAISEGQASFGDGRVLIEKFITSPRHIEIQIFGDQHGNVVHLFERDCSLQRRHQKVIEEAPAPGMGEEMRAAMGEAAVRAAKAVNYSGAGTVEFIVDGSEGLHPDRFWFMEMNTRLQVEHPVTEMITGLDLVRLQLEVANGAPLPFAQEDLSIKGWAFESRVYAEDPANGFLPCIGSLVRYQLPEQQARIDDGVIEGGVISPHYDPMIGKIITYGANRDIALKQMRKALDQSYIGGLTTNLSFLSALCHDAQFNAGQVDTGLIDRNMEQLIDHGKIKPSGIAMGAGILFHLLIDEYGNGRTQTGWRSWGTGRNYFDLVHDGQEIHCIGQIDGDGRIGINLDGEDYRLELSKSGSNTFLVHLDDEVFAFDCARTAKGIIVMGGARAIELELVDPLEADLGEGASSNMIVSPMPGLVKSVRVNKGDEVSEGQVLAVLEAMKMEHSMVAPRDGVVESVEVAEGDQVDDASILIVFEVD